MSRFSAQNQHSFLPKNQIPDNKKKSFLLKTPNQQPKVSTPIRPRLIPTQQLNSTPISLVRKQSQQLPNSQIAKRNKQNCQDNSYKIQPSPSRGNINLKQSNFATLTNASNNTTKALNSVRTKSPIQKQKTNLNSISPFTKMSEGLKSYMQYGTLPVDNQQKQQIPSTKINLTRNASTKTFQTTLQNSNSFKFLGRKNSQVQIQQNNLMFGIKNNDFQNKSDYQQQKKMKNQVIDDIIKNCNKKQQILKTSGIKNDLFSFNQTQPLSKMNQSKSFSKFQIKNQKEQQQGHYQSKIVSEQPDLMCLNNDGRKAKYKVINNNDQQEQEDQDNMFYCSKCAIFLLQQGFKVEDIQTQKQTAKNLQINKTNQLKNIGKKLDDIGEKLKNKFQKMQNNKILYNNNFEKQLEQVDSYYNSLISTIEEMRVKDRQIILRSRDQNNLQFEENHRKVEFCLKKSDQISKNFQQNLEYLKGVNISQQNYHQFLRSQDNQVNQILSAIDLQQNCSSKQLKVEDDLQNKFDEFVNVLYSSFSLKLQFTKKYSIQKNNPMHFSFEKNKLKIQQKKIQNIRNLIKQQPQKQNKKFSDDQLFQQVKKPFRNLFPDESQTENNNQQSNNQQQILKNNNNLIINQQNNSQNQLEQQQQYDCYSPNFKNI